jgi:broad specificity phosphatase PhoE/nicotinamide riboside kinase
VETGGGRRCYGDTDYPLSQAGEAESLALVNWTAKWLPQADGILSSDLSRCTALARPLAEALGLPLRIEPALREQHMGAWEGRTWASLTEEDVAGVRAYWSDYVGTSPPGGESFRSFAERVDAWFAENWGELRGRRWIVVCHTGVARALCCRLLGLEWGEALRFAPVPASHTWLQVAEAGAVLQSLGERPFAQDVGAAAVKRAARAPSLDRPPRIALCGSAGTGKTTLGRALSERLGVPYIPEGMRSRLEAGLDVQRLGFDGLKALVRELWAEQRRRESDALAEHGGFVADRSPVDYAAFWLTYRFTTDRDSTTAFFKETLGAVTEYDRIFCLPWGALPLEADGVRNSNRWVQRSFQALVEGLLHREVPPDRFAMVPSGQIVLDARVAWVLDQLGEAGARAGAAWGASNRA